MIDLFKKYIIASFNKIPIIYLQDSYLIVFSHEGSDFYEILNQFEYSRDIILLRQLSIYDLIDFLEQDILNNEECTAFISSLTAIEIVSILELIIPKLDIFLYLASIDDLINELDTSIAYQEILSHYITTEVLNTYHQYEKKEDSFCTETRTWEVVPPWITAFSMRFTSTCSMSSGSMGTSISSSGTETCTSTSG